MIEPLERIAEIPFSSERRMMSTIHSDRNHRDRLVLFAKGAPDVLLSRCSFELTGTAERVLTVKRRAEILQANETLAGNALRTLAVAMRCFPNDGSRLTEWDERAEQDLVFLGLIGMIDPPRKEAKDAIARAAHAGIRSIMITGDHPKTASVIARQLGIVHNGCAVTGAELEAMPEETMDRTTLEVSVYARVSPAQKLRIVKALRRAGATVAMTGDGVNDAPALRAADIGVAMGITGTDVSKSAAAMVLADDNYATIVAAVEEGRVIFSNIRKFLRYLLSSNMGEVMTIFFGVLLADVIGLSAGDGSSIVLPLLATHVLWLNLVTDGLPALALGVDPATPDVMNTPPRPRSERVVTRQMWFGIFSVGLIMTSGTLFTIDASLPGGLIEGSGTMAHAQTMAFTTLVFYSLFMVFNARSDERSAFPGLFSNWRLLAAVLLSLAMQVAVVHIPLLQQSFSTTSLSFDDWFLCLAVASSVLWLRELSKLIRRRRNQSAIAVHSLAHPERRAIGRRAERSSTEAWRENSDARIRP
jgi:Ca2+-transporting ATPase